MAEVGGNQSLEQQAFNKVADILATQKTKEKKTLTGELQRILEELKKEIDAIDSADPNAQKRLVELDRFRTNIILRLSWESHPELRSAKNIIVDVRQSIDSLLERATTPESTPPMPVAEAQPTTVPVAEAAETSIAPSAVEATAPTTEVAPAPDKVAPPPAQAKTQPAEEKSPAKKEAAKKTRPEETKKTPAALREMAEKYANKPFSKLNELREILGRPELPTDTPERKKMMAKRGVLLETSTIEQYNELHETFVLSDQWLPFLDAKNADEMIAALFTNTEMKELNEGNITKKIEEKLLAVRSFIGTTLEQIKAKEAKRTEKRKLTPKEQDGEIMKKAEQLEPYKPWADLFYALHHPKLPKNQGAQRYQAIERRRDMLGTKSRQDYEELRAELLKDPDIKKCINAKNPIESLRSLGVNVENEANLPAELVSRTDALNAMVTAAKRTIADRKQQAEKAKASPENLAKIAEAKVKTQLDYAMKWQQALAEADPAKRSEAMTTLAGTSNSEEAEAVGAALMKEAHWKQVAQAKDRPAMMETLFTEAERATLNEQNIAEKMKEKLATISQVAKKAIAEHKKAVAEKAETATLKGLLEAQAKKTPSLADAFNAISRYAADQPADRTLMIQALNFLGANTKGRAAINGVKTRVRKLLDTLQGKADPTTKNISEEALSQFFGDLRAHQSSINAGITFAEGRQRAKDLMKTFEPLNLGENEPTFKKIRALLKIDPSKIKNLAGRQYLELLQRDIQRKLEAWGGQFSQEYLQQGLNEQIKAAQTIAEDAKKLNPAIQKFETQVLSALPDTVADTYQSAVDLAPPAKPESAPERSAADIVAVLSPLDMGKNKAMFDKLLALLGIDATKIQDASKRNYLLDLQKSIEKQLTEWGKTFSTDELAKMGIEEKAGVAEKIAESAKSLDPFILRFEKDMLSALPSADMNAYQLAAGLTPTPQTSTAPAGAPTGAPTNAPSVVKKRAAEAEVSQMLSSVLEGVRLTPDSTMYHTIYRLLVGRTDLPEIKETLQNPSLLQKISPEERQIVADEMQRLKLGPNDYTKYIDHLVGETSALDEQIQLLKSQRSSKLDDMRHILDAKKRNNRLKSIADTLKMMHQQRKTYSSPREVLAMIEFYLNAKNIESGDFGIEKMAERLTADIQAGREAVPKKLRGFFRKTLSFLRPNLKQTLKVMAADEGFKSLGESASTKLEELGTIFSVTEGFKQKIGFAEDAYGRVAGWVSSLPGGIEANVTTIVPRLCAYLELAIEEGKSTLFNTDNAKILLEHLYTLRHRYISESLRTSGMNPQEKMLAYVTQINQSDLAVKDINRQLLQNLMFKHYALKGGLSLVAGGLALAAPAALPFLAVPPLLQKSFQKDLPPEQQQAYRRGALRVGLATTLNLVGGMIAWPVGLAMGTLGAFVPELWQRKGTIAKGTAAGLGAAAAGIAVAGFAAAKYTVLAPYYLAKGLFKIPDLTQRARAQFA